jgi:hypothetical protein
MKRRPTPHHTRKRKRRELLQAISELKARAHGKFMDPLLPSLPPETLQVQTIRVDMVWADDTSHIRAQGMRCVAEMIGVELLQKGLLEDRSTIDPVTGDEHLHLLVRVLSPAQGTRTATHVQ